MTSTTPLLIEETNISEAWLKVLGVAASLPGKEIAPLVLTLTGFDETQKVRDLLDKSLTASKLALIETVAGTIFPQELYDQHDNRNDLFEAYLEILPRVRAINSKNGRGTYFERLIAFGGNTNQLEIIIKSGKAKGVRRSKLQAAIFDPKVDHTNRPYQGFPCLQHITFSITSTGGLIINSFYAIQYLYERAYGNWLGLINLGKFMASEMGLTLERFNCFVGVEQLDKLSKSQAESIIKMAK